MGEQFLSPELAVYRPPTDDELVSKLFNLTIIADEITTSLSNPDNLTSELRHELQQSLIEVDNEVAELVGAGGERGLFESQTLLLMNNEGEQLWQES